MIRKIRLITTAFIILNVWLLIIIATQLDSIEHTIQESENQIITKLELLEKENK